MNFQCISVDLHFLGLRLQISQVTGLFQRGNSWTLSKTAKVSNYNTMQNGFVPKRELYKMYKIVLMPHKPLTLKSLKFQVKCFNVRKNWKQDFGSFLCALLSISSPCSACGPTHSIYTTYEDRIISFLSSLLQHKFL